MASAPQGLRKSEWGVLGDKIKWPAGFFPEKRLPGSGVHGETWVISNNVDKVSKELGDLRAKLVDGIQRLEEGIQEASAAMDEPLEGEDEDDVGYDDEYDYADRFDPHDRTDPEVLLEERQALQTELRDKLEEVESKLGELQSNRLDFTWKRRELPHQLHRMDKPWEDFNKEEILAAKKAAEEAEAVERARQKKRAQRKGKKYVEPEQPDADIPDTFIAKLIEPGAVHASDGRRFNSSSMRENVNTLIAEGEIQMKFLWRYIVEKGNFDFEGVGLVPVVYVGKIERSHKDYKTVANAIYIRPYLKHGSVGDVVKMLAGKKKSFYYKDDLLLGNANKFINCMAYLEHYHIYHGSIQPYNIFVSDDGFRLLIGDFLIPTEFKRWMVNMAKKLASVPVFLSPEYREAIVTSRIQKPQYFVEKLSPFKNDVFCFGLVLLYLASMEEPVGFNESAKKCARAAEKLRQKGRQEDLIALISSMLTFNPRERPSWKDLLPTTERWQLQATDLLRGLGNLFGTTQTNPEDLYLDKDLRDADKMKSAAAANIKREEGDAACTIM